MNSPRRDAAALSPALSPIQRARTAVEEVEERLILAIATGDKASGDRVTEAEIAGMLHVSRVPVREAMQRLLLRGILSSAGQRGLVVSDYGERRVADLFEMRLAVEQILLRRVMTRTPEENELLHQELARIIGRMRTLSNSDDPVSLSSVDLEFHWAIARSSGHQPALQVWGSLAQHFLIVFCRDWSRVSDRAGEVVLHEKLANFLRRGRIEDIPDVLAEHLSYAAAGQRRVRRT